MSQNLSSASAVISGTAAFASVAKQAPQTFADVALIFALLTATNLIFGFQRRADLHRDICQSYIRVRSEIEASIEPKNADYKRWQIEVGETQAKEPPEKRALVTLCQDQEDEARGYPPQSDMCLVERWLAQWVSFRHSYVKMKKGGTASR